MPFVIVFFLVIACIVGLFFAVGAYVAYRVFRKLLSVAFAFIARARMSLARISAPRPPCLPTVTAPARLPARSTRTRAARRAMMH